MKTPLILVVDDDKSTLDLIETSLEDKNLAIERAGDGEEALSRIASLTPDLLILDVMMPKLDGIEVSKRIKADEGYSFIPIIMMTARDRTEDKVKGLEAGADDYITRVCNILQEQLSSFLVKNRV